MRALLVAALGCLSRLGAASALPAQCPLFAAAAGTNPALLSKETQLVCPSIHALRKWKALKFGLFMHWGPFAQPVPYDGTAQALLTPPLSPPYRLRTACGLQACTPVRAGG